MKIAIVTLFPEMFAALTDYGISGRAVRQGSIEIRCWNPREFTADVHQTVDDRPYGGGPGMVMMFEPLSQAITAAKAWVQSGAAEVAARAAEEQENRQGTENRQSLESAAKVKVKESQASKVVYLSPQGQLLNQAGVQAFSQLSGLVLVAGRYEGIDERLMATLIDEEWSIGDFVLSGGELPAMVLMDAVIRQLPGVLGHKDSAQEDSFADGLLDHPHYTRPELIQGLPVPKVLLSGDHKKISRWRMQQSLGRTWQRRPDLMAQKELSKEQAVLLSEFQQNTKEY